MIRIVKLINGEEIIGDVEEDTSEFFNIHDPMLIETTQSQQGYRGTGLSNMLSLSTDDFITIDRKNVLTSFTVKDIIKEYYARVRQTLKSDSTYLESSIKQAIKALDSDEDSEAYARLVKYLNSNTTVH